MENYFENTLKPVLTMRDLTQFGINALTGEACAYSMRTLCDVSDDGRALLQEYFGVGELNLAPNWNTMAGDEHAIGSIMLASDSLKALARFAFFRAGALAVVAYSSSIVGVFEQDRLEQYQDLSVGAAGDNVHIYRNPAAYPGQQPVVGSRNMHSATGRVH